MKNTGAGNRGPGVRSASALLAAGLLTGCAHLRTASIKTPQDYPKAHVDRQVINAVDAGDGDIELRTLRAALDANPLDLKARIELANRYQKLGFPEVAIEHGRLAIERAPDSDDAHIALAKLLRDHGRAAEGVAMLSAYTSSHASAGVSAWAWLGLLRDDTGDWKAGEAAHRQAIALVPGRDDLHNNLGYCLLRQGRREEAAAEFRATLKLHPHSAIAENNLALALAVGNKAPDRNQSGDKADAKEAVAHLQSVTDPASAHNNLAVAYIEAGRYAEAHKEIETALRYNQSHSAALNNLRLLSELEGRPAEIQAQVHTESPAGNSADRTADRPGRWARLVSAWHHVRGSSAPDGRTTNDSNATVASR